MAYDEKLAQRLRKVLADQPAVSERKMFGGLAFMVQGNMFCGVLNQDLIVRVGQEQYQKALAEPHTRPMDYAGQPAKGMVFVAPEGYRSDGTLRKWLRRGLDFALSLPPK